MLRIIAQNSAAAAKSYYSKSDYFTEGQELAGVWGGRGAAMLGLRGVAEKSDFDALCDNLQPKSGNQLTVRTRADRRVLYDWNISVPKAVSLLYEIGGDERILDAFRESVDETMQEVETEMKTRVRKHGQEIDRQTGNACWTTFIHRTTRPSKEDKLPDPHLHAHCTVFNATWDNQERRWKAAQFGDLKRDAPYWQAAFDARMAKRMTELGYGVSRTADSWSLTGIPTKLVQKFSRRTTEIEKLADDLGITDPARKDKLGATTRLSKVEASIADLKEYWNGRCATDELGAVAAVRSDAERGMPVIPLTTVGDAVRHAVLHSFERESVVPEKRLVAEALRYGVGTVLPADIRRETDRQGILTATYDGQLVTSTREVLREEQNLLQCAKEGRGTCRPLKPNHIIARDFLDEGQRRAVKHVLESSDRVLLIRGASGVGKTTKMKESVEAIRDTGVPLAVLAQSVRASRGVLRREVVEDANTVASFLRNKDWQEATRGGLIWIDEAGLLGTKDLAQIFDVAKRISARVVLQGDSKQHGSISRGPAFKLLETHAGLPVVAMTSIKRQSGEYRDAVDLLSQGRIAAGFDKLDTMEWVTEVSDEDRNRVVTEDYLRIRDSGEDSFIVCPTHAEGRAITETLREARNARGELGEEREFFQLTNANFTEAQKADAVNYQPTDVLRFHAPMKGIRSGERVTVADLPALPLKEASRFQVFHPGTVRLAVGDPIRLTAGGKSKDGKQSVANGNRYTIQGFTADGDFVLDEGLVLDRNFGTLAPAYVQTSHASQGDSTAHVLVVQSAESYGASNAEQFYVSVSRGKKSVTIYTDDKAGLKAAVLRSDPRISATDLFAKKSKFNSLARRVAFVQRLHSLNHVRSENREPIRWHDRDIVHEA